MMADFVSRLLRLGGSAVLQPALGTSRAQAEALRYLRRIASAFLVFAGSAFAAERLTKVRMSFDEDLVVTRIADALGYFKQQGITIEPVDLTKFVKEDYLVQEALVKGHVDAAEHWFHHTIFGARHGLPVQAVLLLNDAPAMKVMVANRVVNQIKSAADFCGRVVADGAGYATKAVITGYLARQAGLPAGAYTSINHPKAGRLEAVLRDLRAGKLDVLTFQEPVIAGLEESGLVTTLHDLTTRTGTERALGAPFPSESILVAPQFARAHPDTVQRLVNAYVRALRFIESHSPDEVIAALPADYFKGKDRAAETKRITATLPSLVRGDYSFSPRAVALVVDAMLTARFDQSAEGIWRAGGDAAQVKVEALYTNEFVTRAMREIR
jgi:NitT/TauT family transport system substrate-binding protein